MSKNQYGIWEIALPPKAPGEPAIPHESKVKVSSTLNSILDTGKCFVDLDIHDPAYWYSYRKIACLDTPGYPRFDILPDI